VEVQESASASLRININDFKELFETAAKNYPKGRKSFDTAKHYLETLEAKGTQDIFLEDEMLKGLNVVRDLLGV
jgi:hypothetical protein